jgi:hypothetical protein
MFRHRGAIFRDSDKSVVYKTAHFTSHCLASRTMHVLVLDSKLHKAEKHKVINSQYSNIKAVQQ